MSAPGSKSEVKREATDALPVDGFPWARKFVVRLARMSVLMSRIVVIWWRALLPAVMVFLLFRHPSPLAIAAAATILVLIADQREWLVNEIVGDIRKTSRAVFKYNWADERLDDRSMPVLLDVKLGEFLTVREWWTLTKRERHIVMLYDTLELRLRRRWTQGKSSTGEGDVWRKDVTDQQRRRLHFAHHDSGRDDYDDNIDWIELTQKGPSEKFALDGEPDVDWAEFEDQMAAHRKAKRAAS